MSLLVVRLTSLVVLFCSTLFCGLVPVILLKIWSRKKESSFLNISSAKSNSKSKKSSKKFNSPILHLLMFFGGGVLLATCFIHLIPEVRENFELYFKSLEVIAEANHHKDDDHDHDHHDEHDDTDHNESSHDHDHDHHDHDHSKGIHKHKHGIPYVELAICGGFFIIYFFEELIHLLLGRHGHEEPEEESNSSTQQKNRNLAIEPAYLLSCNRKLDNDSNSFINYSLDTRTESNCNGFPIFHTESSDALFQKKCSPNAVKISPQTATEDKFAVRFIRGLVIIAAFSAHSVFDGIAIGLQETIPQIWTMFFAISVHKLVIAFVVGMELYEQTASSAITAIHMILFSSMSPIGILIVILTESSLANGQQSPVVILLSALATGTILYIVFFEILQRDRCTSLPGLVLYFAMIIGFTVMLCITIFITH